MAREDIWIIADNDSADKMVKLHQLKNLASTDLAVGQWYIFSHFDIFTQTAKPMGNIFQQIERGLLNAMRERVRPPTSIVFLIGDSLLNDEKLSFNSQNLYIVLHSIFKQLKNQVRNYTELLPWKTRPIKDIRLFVNKPLPKPEKFFKHRQSELLKAAKARHIYNDKLVAALRQLNMNFINPGIHQANARAFNRTTTMDGRESFILTPDGLHQYWYSLSAGLEKLHKGPIGAQLQQGSKTGRACTTATPQF